MMSGNLKSGRIQHFCYRHMAGIIQNVHKIQESVGCGNIRQFITLGLYLIGVLYVEKICQYLFCSHHVGSELRIYIIWDVTMSLGEQFPVFKGSQYLLLQGSSSPRRILPSFLTQGTIQLVHNITSQKSESSIAL